MADFSCWKGDPTSMPCQVALISVGESAAGSRAGSPHEAAIASNLPPRASVAEVRTTVRCPKSRVRSSPATESGAIRNTGRMEPRLSS
ncbi:Uncharacterised protein [Mycobacteroides abscessus subsp. abscessus]|nr:Uncharacterised protein [Mycobacteroides abscessus subsp. abscessus]SHV24562.1 Uncharacterised protein [Mycobacteroides abscessus subsp. abscessus]SKU54739.1 Uncharacterised protein [Mycobacteroides abscessus subsp. abscessus]SKW68769.1 Uncharacterised protein [Mycobacteroides abscessus subsp. abscessus]